MVSADFEKFPAIHFWGNQEIRLLRGYPTYIMERRAAC